MSRHLLRNLICRAASITQNPDRSGNRITAEQVFEQYSIQTPCVTLHDLQLRISAGYTSVRFVEKFDRFNVREIALGYGDRHKILYPHNGVAAVIASCTKLRSSWQVRSVKKMKIAMIS